ncbi:hypothetical protein NVT87_12355 [Acinetobacter radioresistens]|jgi:hypothetical protein|uniref:hypothetical protein n=1 Tax=Acinetobacter TaxID=469 RepID=UPI0005584014|nr:MULTISPECIES: hypothetical protein [Acinetobacter]KRI29498.1 hypothetical protein APB87_12035 [Acinetobacter pittii]MBJ9451347.1 hypothetical protein [Acinetobacter pittii]MCK4112254.1 hypothetical protein [Acinetobacter radioresistens]MCU4335594.1 hypothetical protein [Acinetobacter pittii]MCU4568130.1 hypothetical protein [Acinetobacter radioresistens]
MKNLLYIMALLVSCNTYAECLLETNQDEELSIELQKKGWNFEKYDELCQKLKAANAGIQISQVGMITQYQTTVSTSIFLYPLELQKKYNQRFLSERGFYAIASNPITTTEMQKGLKHINANYALNSLITDGGLPEMLNNIDKIRKVLKP